VPGQITLRLSSFISRTSATELLNLAYKYAGPGGGNNGQIQGIDDNTGGTNTPAKSTTYTIRRALEEQCAK
jgi:hypothetical protein